MWFKNSHTVRTLSLANIGVNSTRNLNLDAKKFAKVPHLHFLVFDGCVVHGNTKNEVFEEVRYLQLRHSIFMPISSHLVSLCMSGNSMMAGPELPLEVCS